MTQKRTSQENARGKYYDLLLDMRDQLVDQIKDLSSSSLISTRAAGEELADVGSDNFMRDMELTLVGEEQKTFQLIQEAISRVEDGTYGKCIDCGKLIPEGRLKAIPYAKLCISCKEVREANDGMPPEERAAEVAEELVE